MSVSLSQGVSLRYIKELLAGAGITFDETDTTITINSTGGGGGQASIQMQDEGTNLGSAGTVTTLNFTGSGVTASRSLNAVTVNITGGGGGGSANNYFPGGWT
jgi:FlaG/FlaF family flagellin (archaellin)